MQVVAANVASSRDEEQLHFSLPPNPQIFSAFSNLVQLPLKTLYNSLTNGVLPETCKQTLRCEIDVQFTSKSCSQVQVLPLPDVSTPLHFKGKHCTFYSTEFILQFSFTLNITLENTKLIYLTQTKIMMVCDGAFLTSGLCVTEHQVHIGTQDGVGGGGGAGRGRA